MPEIKVVKKVTIPTHFTLGKQFYQKAARHLWWDQNLAISQQQIDAAGRPLKQNAQSTKDLKKARGQPQLSLVDGWRSRSKLYKSTITRNTTRGKVKLTSIKTRKRGTQGHQTNKFHFVGKNAFSIKATAKEARVKYKDQAGKSTEEIIKGLEAMGYKEWIAIREPTQKKILREAVTAFRAMIKKDVRKRGK
jgi:hypothetical protein